MEMKELEPRENEGHNVQGIRSNRWTRASPAGTALGLRNTLQNSKQTGQICSIDSPYSLRSCAAVVSSKPNLQAQKSEVTNIFPVHGAWADGSWRGVYDNLIRDGFIVSNVQEPETSFHDDVTAVKRILALQDGPSILVAHSYGGAVVTEAGTDPSVAGVAYVAAHMPDAGENEADDGKRFPSDLSKSVR
jgi:pimeloyl-ACP methyl ester carboxylesterase